MPITNNSPDNGQPCLTPRSTGKNSDPNPLLRTQLETLLYKILTQFLMFGPKLNFSRQLLIKSLSMVSKAFLKSINRAIPEGDMGICGVAVSIVFFVRCCGE